MLLGNERIKAICDAFKLMSNNEFPESIYLSKCSIKRMGGINIMNSLKYSLKILDISFNRIGFECIDILGRFINNINCNLYHINLEGNRIGDEHISRLIEDAATYPRLSFLNIGGNNCGKETVTSIRDHLELEKTELLHLMLRWNNITAEMFQILPESLKKNGKLKTLDLSYNRIGNSVEVISDFVNALKENKELHHLDISHNLLNREALETFERGIRENHSI